jgi:hypothetical protein
MFSATLQSRRPVASSRPNKSLLPGPEPKRPALDVGGGVYLESSESLSAPLLESCARASRRMKPDNTATAALSVA